MNAEGIIGYDTFKCYIDIRQYPDFVGYILNRYPTRSDRFSEKISKRNSTIWYYHIKASNKHIHLEIFNNWQLHISASLPVHIYGDNYNLVDHSMAGRALYLVAEALGFNLFGIDIKTAVLTRLDVTITLDVPYRHSELQRVIQYPRELIHRLDYENGIMIGTRVKNKGRKNQDDVITYKIDLLKDYSKKHNRVVLWYGKVDKLVDKSNEPEVGSNLRLECRVFSQRRIKKFMGRKTLLEEVIKVGHLLNEQFYNECLQYVNGIFNQSMINKDNYKYKQLNDDEETYTEEMSCAFTRAFSNSIERLSQRSNTTTFPL